MTPQHRTGFPSSRTLAMWWLVLALLAAQTVGLLHRIAHPTQSGTAAVVARVATFQAGTEARGWTQDLFASHEGDAGCRLYDQLGAAALACAEPPAVGFATPMFVVAWAASLAWSAFESRFSARGPPSLR